LYFRTEETAIRLLRGANDGRSARSHGDWPHRGGWFSLWKQLPLLDPTAVATDLRDSTIGQFFSIPDAVVKNFAFITMQFCTP